MPVNIKVVYITKYNKKFILNKPDNFAYYIKSIMNSNLIDVHLLNPLPLQKNNSIQTLIALVKTIKDINPDILYLDNLQGLNKLVVLKRVGILKCKIVAWKYTYCKEYSNSIKNWFTKFFYWKGIDRIYMMFDNHTRHALSHNIVKDYQITTLSRGAEIKWYEKYLKPQKDNFLVMATGKDSRDYQTLSEACEQTQTNCHIITRRHESNIKVAEKFKNSQYIKFTFMEDLHINNEYEYIMQQQGQASILAIPCERREYGVGYTNIVEALPYYIPILMTHNPDIHIDLEKENIGYLIEPYDVGIPFEETICRNQRDIILKKYDESKDDYKNDIQSVIKEKPERIILIGFSSSMGKVLKSIRAYDFKGEIICNLGLTNSDVMKAAGDAIVDTYYIDYDINKNAETTKRNQFLLEKYHTNFSSTSYLAYAIPFCIDASYANLRTDIKKASENIKGLKELYVNKEYLFQIDTNGDVRPTLTIKKYEL